MKILDIYENAPDSYSNKNYSLVWCSRLDTNIKNISSIYDLINDQSKNLKIESSNFLQNFFNDNKIYFYPFFNLKKDFTYLTLSNFIEKNPYKKNINLNILKILALNNFIRKNKFDKIIVHTKKEDFLRDINNIIKIRNKPQNKLNLINKFLKLTKLYFKNLIQFVIFFIKNISFKNKPNSTINKKPIFFSFFSYTDKKKAMSGIYHSEYWKGFSNTNNKNWVHLHDYCFNYQNSKDTRKAIKNLNLNKKVPNHFFLDDYLNIKIFIKTIFTYNKFYFLTSKLILSKNFSKILEKKLYLTNKDNFFFFNEFISYNTIRNILFFYQFEEFFLKNKIESDIFYTFENQPWEKILLYFLKKNKFKKKTYGTIHSPVRFWDLRFINFNNNKSILGYFNPDKILFNSAFIKKILLLNGYKKKELIPVETLRYLNFNKIEKNKKKLSRGNNKKINLLILSDYDDNLNNHFIKIINHFKSNNKYCFFLKCHPLKPLKIIQDNVIIISDINHIKKNIDLVIVANKTAAALDFYYKNFDTLIFLDKDDLDYSPLHRFTNYRTFSSLEDLKKILDIYHLKSKESIVNTDTKSMYFNTNKSLIGWKKIIRL
jgi:surface carbohydrate biosynthesis protein (TIGR04326 family)